VKEVRANIRRIRQTVPDTDDMMFQYRETGVAATDLFEKLVPVATGGFLCKRKKSSQFLCTSPNDIA